MLPAGVATDREARPGKLAAVHVVSPEHRVVAVDSRVEAVVLDHDVGRRADGRPEVPPSDKEVEDRAAREDGIADRDAVSVREHQALDMLSLAPGHVVK